MKKITQIAVMLGVLLVVAAVAQPANATCAVDRTIATINAAGGYSYIYTPGVIGSGYAGNSVNGSVDAAFWRLGYGDPTLGIGVDNGSFPASGCLYGSGCWLYHYPGPYGVLIITGWGQSALIEGCGDTAPGMPKCTAVYLSDVDSSGQGVFAVVSVEANANQNYDLVQPDNAPINLVAIPKPNITGSTRIDASNVEFDIAGVSAASIAGGLYLDPNCPDAIAGYRIRVQNVARGGLAPSDRDIGQWNAVGGVNLLGTTTTLTVGCAGDQDIYVTQSIIFDSGFEAGFVSDNSNRVECGPNLADPGLRPSRIRPNQPLDLKPRSRKR